MNRLDGIIKNPIFRDVLENLAEQEKDRVYCCHGIVHLLEVARTAYIISLQRSFDIKQDIIYAAALLHDIGRSTQYSTGEPHEQAGISIASQILNDTLFDEQERQSIIDCVRSHHKGAGCETVLQKLICEADKKSRPCYACEAAESCKWSNEQKNLSLTI